MHRAPARRRDARIDAARDEIVRETEAALRRQQHRLPRAGLERLADAVPVEPGHARKRGRVDAGREHRGPAQHLAALLIETREALLDELVERLSAVAGRLGARELDREQRVTAAFAAE